MKEVYLDRKKYKKMMMKEHIEMEELIKEKEALEKEFI
jgi:hypothetical protein